MSCKYFIALLFFTVGSVLCGCDPSGSSSQPSQQDLELRELIGRHRLTGDASIGRELPNINDPLPQLGMKLFFSKSLGGDMDSACVTCHHPFLGGGDNLPLSIGIGADNPDHLGPGRTHRDGDFTVPRNAPTTFNLGLWDQTLFWDGRAESLGKTPFVNGDDGEGIRTPDSKMGTADPLSGPNLATAQARFPVTSPEEMRGFEFVAGGTNEELRTALAKRLSKNWGEEFEQVFGDDGIGFDRVATAIGEYERSQVFVDTPWRDYVMGDLGAISEEAKRGALLFYRSREEGGADCVNCHTGDLFTDEVHWAIGAPQIGRGKGDGATGTNDFGRARETKKRKERFQFRTPTLLNVAVTGPWTHAGAFDDLHSLVRHLLDPKRSLEEFDPTSVALASLDGYEQNKQEIITALDTTTEKVISTFADPIEYDDQMVSDLVAFLGTLTDRCVESRECLSQWIPAENATDPDGNRLVPDNLD